MSKSVESLISFFSTLVMMLLSSTFDRSGILTTRVLVGQEFSYWGRWGESPPPAENLLILPAYTATPIFYSPPPKFSSPALEISIIPLPLAINKKLKKPTVKLTFRHS